MTDPLPSALAQSYFSRSNQIMVQFAAAQESGIGASPTFAAPQHLRALGGAKRTSRGHLSFGFPGEPVGRNIKAGPQHPFSVSRAVA